MTPSRDMAEETRNAVKWEPFTIDAGAVRRLGITPWRLVLWARRERRPERARNLLRAAVAMIEAEAAALRHRLSRQRLLVLSRNSRKR